MKTPHKPQEGPQWEDEVLWSSIEQELDKDDRRRRIAFWLWFGGALAIVALCSIYLCTTSTVDQKSTDLAALPEARVATPHVHVDHNIHSTDDEPDQAPEPYPIKTTAPQTPSTPTSRYAHTRTRHTTKNTPSTHPIRSTSSPTSKTKATNNSKAYAQDNDSDRCRAELKPTEELEHISVYLHPTSRDILNQKTSIATSPATITSRFSWIFKNSLYKPYHTDQYNSGIPWQQAIASQEKPLYATSHGLSIDYALNDAWSLRSGIVLRRMESHLQAVDIQSTTSTVLVDSAFVASFSDKKQYYTGYVNRTHTITKNYSVYNAYTQVAMPLDLVYKHALSKRSRLVGSIGISISMYSHLKGYTLTESLRVRRLSNTLDGGGWNIGIQNIASSIAYRRQLAYGCSLEAGLGGYIGLKPIRTTIEAEQNTYSRTYHGLGIKLGIQRHF